MRNVRWMVGLAIATGLLAPLAAQAQVRGFSARQQASLFLYQQQIRQQARIRQQQQLQAIQRQFINQRQDIERNRRVQQRQIDQFLNPVDPYDPRTTPEEIATTRRGTAVFGDPHYGSSLFNRIEPYYDYSFVSRRNRPVSININQGNSIPSSGFGNIIFGSGFGSFAVPY